MNGLLLDHVHELLDNFMSFSGISDQLWKIVAQNCNKEYKIVVNKDDLLSGYLLGSVIDRFGLECNFRSSSFDKHHV